MDRIPRRPGPRPHLRLVLLMAAAAGVTACGTDDDPMGPGGGDGAPVFHVQPSDVAVGHPFDRAVRVVVRDGAGRLMETGDPVTLRLEGTPSRAGLTGETSRRPDPWLATFHRLSVDEPGSYRLVAEWRGRTAESLPFVAVPEPDLIRIHNASERARGVVVDGETSREFLNDHLLATRDTFVELIRLRPGPNGEVIVFDRGRAVTAVPAPWSPGVDTVDVVLRDPIRIPVTVRNLSAWTPDAQRGIDQWIATWDSEGMGIVPEVEFVDLSSEDGAGAQDGREFCREGSAARERWGFDPDRINIYLVQFEGTGGLACRYGGQVVLITNLLAGTGTLYNHEVGHLFGLHHYFDWGLKQFADTGNIMGGGGWFMTEGQIFFQHYSDASALVRVYGIDPGVRPCSPARNSEADRPECLVHRFRIWEDGW
ncbi:MAG: hypothetical protein PVI57_11170 [Gemmatimonadota bacterium]